MDNGDHGVIVDEIVDTDFNVELSGTSNNVLTGGLVIDTKDLWVGLGESLHSLDELGEICGILGLNSNSNDGGDGVLHDSDIASLIGSGDGTGLGEVLIDSDKSDKITAWDFRDELSLSSHQQNSSLNVTFVEIGFLSKNVVGSHHSDLETSGNLS